MTAEALRLRYRARRTATRIMLFSLASLLGLGTILFGHIAVWYWLREYMAGQFAALIFMGTDLLLAVILCFIAINSGPGKVEQEALAIRDRAWENAMGSLTVSALAMQLARLLFMSRAKN